jgi:pyruvyltransferase
MNSTPFVQSQLKLLQSRFRRLPYKLQGWKTHFSHNAAHIPRSWFNRKTIRAFWFHQIVNFGDKITVDLLKHYGYLPLHALPNRASFTSAGSILQLLPSNFPGIILGSGLLSECALRFESASILGVRGAYTRDLIQAPQDTVLGDPGLLLPQISPNLPARKYLVGLIPHFKDKGDKRLRKILENYPAYVHLIDVQRSPSAVLHDIARCEYILSSSLHGLVVADALGIPNAWLVQSDKVLGKGFKFRDYYSAFNCSYDPISLIGEETLEQLVQHTHVPSPQIPSIQARLDQQFKELAYIL